MITNSSTNEDELLVSKVTKKLTSVNYFPQVGTMRSLLSAETDLLALVRKKLQEIEHHLSREN